MSRARPNPVAVAVLAALLPCACAKPDESAASVSPVVAAGHTSAADARSAWLRVTPRGLRTLPAALRASLGAEVTVPIPRTRQDDLTLCADDRCHIRLQLDELVAEARDASRVGLRVTARAATSPIRIRYEQTWPCAFTSRPECAVTVDTTRARPAALTAAADVVLGVDRGTGLAWLTVDNAAVPHGLDGGDVDMGGANTCGRVWCNVANLAGASGFLADRANEALVSAIRREADSRTCLPCASGGVCPAGSRCVEGVCRRGGNDAACAPLPLAAETTIDAPDEASGARIAVALADDAAIRRGGVEASLRISAAPTTRHRCAPPVPAPDAVPVPRAVLDRGGDAGAIRIALGEAALARVAWALHQGGVGCVDVGAAEVPPLSMGLGALLPSARRIRALGASDPVVSVRPLAPPIPRLLDDGSIELSANVQLSIWATVAGRRLRMASATAAVRGVARLGMRDGDLAVEVPHDGLAVEVGDHWSAAVLGASERELVTTFDALASVATAVVPEATPLANLPLPGRATLVGEPRVVAAGGTRALVVSLDLEPPR